MKTITKIFNNSQDMFVKSPFKAKIAKDLLGDPISIDSTVEMSSLLLQERPLCNIARFISWGAVFQGSAFAMQPNMVAVRLWYCYNPHAKNGLSQFFLALEHIDKDIFDVNYPEKLSTTTSFIVPEIFMYDKADFEDSTIRKFILDHNKTTAQTTQITAADIKEFSDNFKSLMLIISPSATQSYCKYAVAIFAYDDPYKKFLEAPQPTWVRYYMGLARDPSHKPNYLRPILAGVDKDGKLIRREGKDVNNKAVDESFLQKSVPPPPHQLIGD